MLRGCGGNRSWRGGTAALRYERIAREWHANVCASRCTRGVEIPAARAGAHALEREINAALAMDVVILDWHRSVAGRVYEKIERPGRYPRDLYDSNFKLAKAFGTRPRRIREGWRITSSYGTSRCWGREEDEDAVRRDEQAEPYFAELCGSPDPYQNVVLAME